MSSNPCTFLRRHGIFQEIQGSDEFLCGNIWHFEAKKAKKFFFRPKKSKFTRSLRAVWYMKFLCFLCFDFFDFSIEKIMEASKKFTRQCRQIV